MIAISDYVGKYGLNGFPFDEGVPLDKYEKICERALKEDQRVRILRVYPKDQDDYSVNLLLENDPYIPNQWDDDELIG